MFSGFREVCGLDLRQEFPPCIRAGTSLRRDSEQVRFRGQFIRRHWCAPVRPRAGPAYGDASDDFPVLFWCGSD